MKRWPELAASSALVAALAGAVIAQETPVSKQTKPAPSAQADDAQANTFAIRNLRVFDGERTLANANVVVRDGRIAAVGSRAAIPDGIAIIDGAGKTLLPGLIDAHTHSWGNAQADALRFGVTTELDMMGDWRRIPALRAQREGYSRTTQADLWTAGAAVTAPGGHGTQYFPVPSLAPDGDAKDFVAGRVKDGSDYIKIIVEDFSAHSATRRLPTLSPAQVAAAIDAAHASDRRAVVHASKQADALHAVQSGADGLVHLFVDAPASAAFVQAAKENGTFVVPTLSVMAGFAGADEGAKLAGDARLQSLLSAEQSTSLKASFPSAHARPQVLPQLLASVRALHAAGIDVLAGTDAGNPGTAHGAGLHGELELLVRAGLTPSQALAAATSRTAKRFALDDRGRIAPGLRADLLLVEGDPTVDITATRAIARIWKNGFAVARTPDAVATPGAPAPAAMAPATQDGSVPAATTPATPDAQAPAAKANVNTATAAPAGTVLSDFDGGTLDAKSGGSWSPTTDAMMGGTSTVAHALVHGGANGSTGALEITGEVKQGASPYTMWSGMILMPGAQPMQPVDFSARRELVFHARGDGRTYQAMLFSGPSAQDRPSLRTFVAGPAWKEVRIPLSDFAGADPKQLRAIAFTTGAPAGTFSFRIDQVELR